MPSRRTMAPKARRVVAPSRSAGRFHPRLRQCVEAGGVADRRGAARNPPGRLLPSASREDRERQPAATDQPGACRAQPSTRSAAPRWPGVPGREPPQSAAPKRRVTCCLRPLAQRHPPVRDRPAVRVRAVRRGAGPGRLDGESPGRRRVTPGRREGRRTRAGRGAPGDHRAPQGGQAAGDAGRGIQQIPVSNPAPRLRLRRACAACAKPQRRQRQFLIRSGVRRWPQHHRRARPRGLEGRDARAVAACGSRNGQQARNRGCGQQAVRPPFRAAADRWRTTRRSTCRCRGSGIRCSR
jgi:hypothetical protein